MCLKNYLVPKLALLMSAAPLLAFSFAFNPGPSPVLDKGYEHFYNNEFDQALDYFEQQVNLCPTDPEVYNHVAQALLYREMLRDGVLESQLVTGNNPFLRRPKMEIDPAEKQRFNDSLKQALALGQARLQKNPRDVAALSAISVTHGLRANYSFVVEKAWMDSLHEATAARKAAEQAVAIDPSAVDPHLILGLNQYVAGSLPFYLRAMGSFAGFHGNKSEGIRQLEMVAEHGTRNRYDAEILLAVLYRRERCPEKAIPLLEDLAARFPRNHLFRFEQVQMYSDLGDKQSALRVLAKLENLCRNQSAGYADLHPAKVQYLKGNLLFWYGDLDPALASLRLVTQQAGELDLNTAVLAWLRLGQVYDLQGNHQEAIRAYRETVKTAPKSEAADEAKGYISNPYRRKHAASPSAAEG